MHDYIKERTIKIGHYIIETRNTVLECLADFFHKALGGMPAKKREEVLESVKIFIAAINNSADGCGCC